MKITVDALQTARVIMRKPPCETVQIAATDCKERLCNILKAHILVSVPCEVQVCSPSALLAGGCLLETGRASTAARMERRRYRCSLDAAAAISSSVIFAVDLLPCARCLHAAQPLQHLRRITNTSRRAMIGDIKQPCGRLERQQ